METFLWIVAIIAVIAIWNQFFRNRCPKCRSTSFNQIGKQQISSDIDIVDSKETKTVPLGGSTSTALRDDTMEYQETFKVDVFELTFQCKECKNQWTKKDKKRQSMGKRLINKTSKHY